MQLKRTSEALQTHFDTIAAYRKKVPEADDKGNRGDVDLAWMAAWGLPEKRLASFVEGILYKNQYQKLVRQNVANKQSPKEVLSLMEIEQDFVSLFSSYLLFGIPCHNPGTHGHPGCPQAAGGGGAGRGGHGRGGR